MIRASLFVYLAGVVAYWSFTGDLFVSIAMIIVACLPPLWRAQEKKRVEEARPRLVRRRPQGRRVFASITVARPTKGGEG